MRRPGRSTRVPLLAPAVLLHAASWFAVLAHGVDWIGAWMNAVDQVAGSVVIVGPLVAGLTANTYARLDQTALPGLVVSSVHPIRAWYEPALRLWAVGVANLVVVLGQVSVLVATAGQRVFARPALILPVCFLVLAVHALVGMVVGLNLGPRLAGPVAGTTAFGLFLLSVAGLAPAAFNPAGVGGVLVGQQYRVAVLAVLAVIALLTAAAIACATGWNTRFRRSRFLAAVIGVTGAVALSTGPVDLDRRYDAVAAPLSCRGAAPRVCLPQDAVRSLPDAAARMHRFSAPLLAAGVDLPQRWVYSWGQRQPRTDGMLRLYDRAVLGSRVPDDSVVQSLTFPAWCSATDDAAGALEVRLLLARWIAFRNGLGQGDSHVPKAWFVSTESETWVRTTYAKLRRCDADLTLPRRLDFPVSGR